LWIRARGEEVCSVGQAGAERLGSAGLKLYTSKLIAPVVELSALRQVLLGKAGAELLKKHFILLICSFRPT
jgi:hypothetical protein